MSVHCVVPSRAHGLRSIDRGAIQVAMTVSDHSSVSDDSSIFETIHDGVC